MTNPSHFFLTILLKNYAKKSKLVNRNTIWMSMDNKCGDWIVLWGLTNMLNILVSLVSSLGEAGLKIINPNAREEETGDFGALALLHHEAKGHYHSLEPASNTANPKDVVSELKVRKTF